MKTKKIISAAIITAGLCLQNFVIAQSAIRPVFDESNYNNAIGFRVGETSGLTFKHFFQESSAIEGILGMWPNAVSFTGLYEKHTSAFNVEGLQWYYGGGGHIAFESRRYYYTYYNYDNRYFYRYGSNGNMGFGIDGILGLEYKIKPIPFAFSFDMKPFFEINSNGGVFLSLDPGLGIKFVLK